MIYGKFIVRMIVYGLFLLTFLVYPIAGLILSRRVKYERTFKSIKYLAIFFVLHNILFYCGFSIKGDITDYFVFSSEYLCICFAVFILLKFKNIYIRILAIIGTIGVAFNFIVGLIGILLFIVIQQDYSADKHFYFQFNGNKYETRRYSDGFATSMEVYYTFETYRVYPYIPFERKIDKTEFINTKSDLDFYDEKFIVNIVKIDSRKKLQFKSSNGKTYRKVIDP